jgi:hypothetical protein
MKVCTYIFSIRMLCLRTFCLGTIYTHTWQRGKDEGLYILTPAIEIQMKGFIYSYLTVRDRWRVVYTHTGHWDTDEVYVHTWQWETDEGFYMLTPDSKIQMKGSICSHLTAGENWRVVYTRTGQWDTDEGLYIYTHTWQREKDEGLYKLTSDSGRKMKGCI